MRVASFLLLPPIILAPTYAFAAHYLTAAEAQRVIFPELLSVEAVGVAFSPGELSHIRELTNRKLDPSILKVWRVLGEHGFLGTFVVYEVLGKHELITFAVGINPDLSVRSMEILDYRESYGDEVAEIGWRRQFTGKKISDPLGIGKGIANISGATISSKNITAGVDVVRRAAELKQWTK